jgi:hypothetical protein
LLTPVHATLCRYTCSCRLLHYLTHL